MSHGQRRFRVQVLGSFTLLRDGAAVPLGVDPRRLVAYLAVHPRPQARPALAADLWPTLPPEAAVRVLDDAVTALDVPGLLADLDGDALALAPAVEVDLAEAMALVRALPGIPLEDRPRPSALLADILPRWTATWLAVERERFRQLRLHALEELSHRLTDAGRHTDAVEVARAAVHTAPSRESARRTLIEAHLAQGEIAEAVAQHDEYQELLRSSIGGPTPFGLDALLPPSPVWPVLPVRRPFQRSAVVLPGLRSIRNAPGASRRLVAGGAAPVTPR